MPEPLSYATPDLNRRRPWNIDYSVILIGLVQLLVAVCMVGNAIFGDPTHVHEGRWFARLAWWWVHSGLGLAICNTIATAMAIWTAFGPKGTRLRGYVRVTAIFMLALALDFAAPPILRASKVYVSSLPSTIPVNDSTYYPEFRDEVMWAAMLISINPILTLFFARAVSYLFYSSVNFGAATRRGKP